MTTIGIYNISDDLLLSTPVNSGAKGYYSLMQHDYITLPFSLQSPVEFGIGSYADLREAFSDALGGKLAKIYKVCDLQTPTYNTSTGGYDYELRLDAYYWLWKNKIFKYTPEAAGQEASWSLTASLDVHLGVFLRNLDALGETYGEKEYEFSIDSTVENKAVAITYDNTNLIDALSRMAEAWDCEWWVTENVIHFGRLENGDAVELEIGVQAEDMTRNESKGTYATRIYAFGSTRNIPENYRPNDNEDLTVNGVVQKRLMLPDGTPYIDARPGLTGQEVVESVVVFDDIYPRRVGTLSDVKTVDRAIEDEEGNQTGTFKAYQYKDAGLTFSPDYVLEGQELRIVFQSGKMNGLDFGVTFNPDNADPAEQLWEIVANEDYGRRLPDEVIKPENGDTYILYGFDIKLVSDQYIPAAEQELKAKAEEYVAKTQVDDGTYTVALYSSWVKEDEVNRTFDAGQRIKLKNPAFFGTSGRMSRVIGWEMCLDIPYDRPVYTIGESAQYSRLGELEDKVDSLTLNGQAYQGIGGGSGVYLIRTNDSTPASNSNAYSALRARQEFISKTKDDTAKGKITFVKGIDIGTFSQNAGGGTFRALEDLTTYAEVDRLRVRVKAYFETLEIINTNSVGGKMILTAGGGVYLREVKDRETLEDGTEQVWDFYRCYFLTEQDGREVENRFHVGDLAMSQSFNIKAGTHQGVTNHYYWREVVGIGDDYIDLSKTICDTGSDAPMAEDTVCHLGNRSDKDRQGAIIFSAVDVFSPSITLYYGINDFSLVNKDYVSYGVDKSTGNAFFRVYGEMYAGDREQTSYVKYTPGVGVEMRGKFLNQAGESYDTIIDSIQNAIDGNIETWFGEEEPTLSNEPAVNWTTDEDKNTHLGDLYYSDAGVAYRFQMEGAQYVWKMLKDSDITKALADAKAAKDAADAAKEAADAAADRLTAWASDGVISPTEKQGIKDEIARIDADKANITAQYTKYGLGTPTTFNNAYTAYRAVLVSLSASTPENIAIPSDFSSKQTYYYNERTSALGAIADASISSVNNVTEQLEQMQQDFAEVKEDVAGVKTSVDGLKNFTDEAFADGIVDRNESAAIASHINSIETFAKDAAESYTKVYENTLLTGTAKTNLANAYTAFTTAKTELVTTINGAIADGLVDALEKSAVDGKYTAFNTKYGDFVANLNAANRAIQDAINQNALQALRKIGELDYLKAALKEFTTIEGGLIQSSTLALGYTSDSGYQVMAGTNGIYDASKLGGGIASWWGGAMFDRFEYTEETMPENVASALVRMDGTGYFAKGNLWWESDGTLHADPLSFFVGEDSVGDVLGLFQFVKSDAGIEYVIPQYPFQKLEIGNYLQIGKAQLYWDEANQAFYVRHQDGVSPVGFYATGFISAKGANPNAGGTVSGASSLDELNDVSLSGLQDGQVLSYDTSTQKWVNKSVSAGGIDEDALAEYLTTNQYAKKGDISIAGLTDLHSSWDAVLKAQKPAWLTTVSLATISDLHASWDALLKAAPTDYVTRWPGVSEVTGLQDALNLKLDAATFNDLFEKVEISTGVYAIRAKYGLYSNDWISAKGANPDAGGVVSGATDLDGLSDVTLTNMQNGQVLMYNGSQWVNNTLDVGLDETALAQYLTSHLYATQSWVNSQNYATEADLDARIDALVNGAPAAFDTLKEIADVLQGNVDSIGDILTALGNKADKTITITAGTGLTGGGNLSANRTLSLATVGTAGTYTKVTVDAYGRVTGHASLAATDIPNLPWSKITSGKPTTLSGYGITDAYTKKESNAYYLYKSIYAPDSRGCLVQTDIAANGDAMVTVIISGNNYSGNSKPLYSLLNFYNYQSGDGIINISCQNVGFAFGDIKIFNYGGYVCLWLPYHHEFMSYSLFIFTTNQSTYRNRVTSITNAAVPSSATRLVTVTPKQTALTSDNVYSATKLQTAREIWGQSFNGEADVSGALSNATTITASGQIQGGSFKLGSGTITWDATNNCFHFSHGLYSDSFVSAKGANSGSGGTVSGVTKLSDLSDVQLGTLATNQVLSWNGSKWVNKAISTGLDETALAQYLTNNQYLTMPTGDARYVTLATAQTISGKKTFTAQPTIVGSGLFWGKRMSVNTPNYEDAICWLNTSLTQIAKIGYHNTAQNIIINPINASDVWSDAIGKYSLFVGNNKLTYNTYPILTSNNYTSYIDTRYVKKAGDTMTGSLHVPILYLNYSGVESNIHSKNNGFLHYTTAASIGHWFNKAVYVSGEIYAGSVYNQKVWHAGNDGSGSGLDADLLDGKHASSFLTNANLSSGLTDKDLDYATFNFGVTNKGDDNEQKNVPTNYGAYLSITQYNINYGAQLFFDTAPGSTGTLYFRTRNSGDNNTVHMWKSWKTVIDSTNIGSYNAGSATRLQTSQKIWGQPFDGTAPVSGNMTGVGKIFSNLGDATIKTYQATNSIQTGITNETFCLQSCFDGQDGETSSYPSTYPSRCVIALQPRGGNVGIGTTSPSYKLHVAGTGYFSGALSTASTITASGLISTTGASYTGSNGYGVAYRAYSSGHTSIEICGGNYVMGLGCHSNGSWNWWRGTSGYSSTSGKSYVMTYNGSTWAFMGALAATTTIYATTGIYSNGYVSAKGQNSSSDLRLKTILSPVHPSLEAFAKAPLFRFAWKSNPGMVEIGSSAQYWKNVLPDTVKERDGWLEMGYGNIALAGVITIARDFETLEQRVERLEKDNKQLKKELSNLKRRIAA